MDSHKTAGDKALKRNRRVPRRSYQKEIGVLYCGKYSIDQAYEIGERGMLITSKRELKKDSRVLLSFHVPGVLQTIVQGIVKYSRDNGGMVYYGVEFEKIDFSIRRLIRSFVATKTEKEHNEVATILSFDL